jgi:hypothetical protein
MGAIISTVTAKKKSLQSGFVGIVAMVLFARLLRYSSAPLPLT